MENGSLEYGPMRYHTLILAGIRSLELETARAIDRFVTQGGRLIMVDPGIVRTSSYQSRESDQAVQQFLARWKSDKKHVTVVHAPEFGTDLTTWTGQLFRDAHLQPDLVIHQPDRSLYQIHHTYSGRDIYFITNTNHIRPFSSDLTVDLTGKSLWKWNPENGRVTRMDVENNVFRITLNPLESCLLVTGEADPAGKVIIDEPVPAKVDRMKLDNGWKVGFYPVEGNPFSREFKDLLDLKDSNDPALRNFAGKMIYKTDITLPDTNFDQISLGEVNEGVTEVIINGTNLGTRWYGLHEYELGSCLKAGTNQIEIVYTTLLFNFCKSLENVEAKRWIGNRDLISTGLLGPVVLKSLSSGF